MLLLVHAKARHSDSTGHDAVTRIDRQNKIRVGTRANDASHMTQDQIGEKVLGFKTLDCCQSQNSRVVFIKECRGYYLIYDNH
jgi:hypothetical protein